jgi:hypothetical protein
MNSKVYDKAGRKKHDFIQKLKFFVVAVVYSKQILNRRRKKALNFCPDIANHIYKLAGKREKKG